MGNIVIIFSDQVNPILKAAELKQMQELKESFYEQKVKLIEIGLDIMILFESNQESFQTPSLYLLNSDEQTEKIIGGDLVFLSGVISNNEPVFATLSAEQEKYIESSLLLEYPDPLLDNEFYFLFKKI